MTLTTHAIVGASIAQFFPQHPIAAFFLGFASHFVMDAIPHREYDILSIKMDREHMLDTTIDTKQKLFLLDLFRIGFDFWLGILLALLFFSILTTSPWVTLLGALGAILPDPLQFLYWKWKHQPLTTLQKFHIWIHTNIHLEDYLFTGIFSQVALIGLAVFIVYFFKHPLGIFSY